MASARLEKLKVLLKRVEERRAKPRLHAVAAPRAAAPAARPAEDESTAAPPAAAPHVSAPGAAPPAVAPAAPPAAAPPTVAPAAAPPAVAPPGSAPAAPRTTAPEPLRPAAKSPLEDAIGDFDVEPQLEVRALAEPITAPRAERRPAFPSEPEPAVTYRPEPAVTHRPEPVSIPAARPAAPAPAPLAEVVPLQIATAATNVSSKATLEFGMPRVELPAPPRALSGPTETVEPAPLAPGTPPARAVSAVRAEVPKSFGELLELSLSLRPR